MYAYAGPRCRGSWAPRFVTPTACGASGRAAVADWTTAGRAAADWTTKGRAAVADWTTKGGAVADWTTATEDSFFTAASESFFTGKGRDTAVESVRVALLWLRPKNRCWLQYLVRFVKLVSENRCLVLDPTGIHNRYVALNMLWDKVCKPTEEMPTSQVLRLVTFMIDFESEVFRPSEMLNRAVVDRLIQIRKEKPCYTVEAREETSVSFCEQISSKEFEQQRRTESQEHLAKLLDSVTCDENLKPKRKREQLKKFEREYPDIFRQKFPTANSAEALFPEPKSGAARKFFNVLRI